MLLTSFRPSALEKLDLGWKKLHSRYPALSQVAIVGAPGARAEEPGHDLTYLADNGLVPGMDLPPTLYADMSGSLMASEAVLQAALQQSERYAGTGEPHPRGRYLEVALSDAAAYLALPRQWGLDAIRRRGGRRACRLPRLSPAGTDASPWPRSSPISPPPCAQPPVLRPADLRAMFAPTTHQAIAAFLLSQTRQQLDRLGAEKDIPLHTMA